MRDESGWSAMTRDETETMQGVSCVVRTGHEHERTDAEIDKRSNPQKASSMIERGGCEGGREERGMRSESKIDKMNREEMEGKIYRE